MSPSFASHVQSLQVLCQSSPPKEASQVALARSHVQRPYFPEGRLRDALCYPGDVDSYTDVDLQQALMMAVLPQFITQLDKVGQWSQQLSGGEAQRLAMARVFLKQPHWVFADEATSALDEATEKVIYERLLSMVKSKGGALVSVAHRPSVAAFHPQRWELEKLPPGAAAQYQLRAGAQGVDPSATKRS